MKLRNPLYLSALTLAITLTGCQTEPKTDTPTPAVSAQQTPWVGNYTGMVPCADCEAIEVELALIDSARYVLKTRPLGKRDATQKEVSGQYTRVGNTLTLDQSTMPNKFMVGEHVLVPLDENGNRYTSAKADRYLLKRVHAVQGGSDTPALPPSVLDGKVWKLVEMQGAVLNKSFKQRPPTIQFKGESQRFYGFSGCNNFSGQFEIREGNVLILSKVATTRKACPNMEAESGFLSMLNSVERFSLAGETLTFQKAGTSVAKFKGSTLR